jgi:hypothetical protein
MPNVKNPEGDMAIEIYFYKDQTEASAKRLEQEKLGRAAQLIEHDQALARDCRTDLNGTTVLREVSGCFVVIVQ